MKATQLANVALGNQTLRKKLTSPLPFWHALCKRRAPPVKIWVEDVLVREWIYPFSSFVYDPGAFSKQH